MNPTNYALWLTHALVGLVLGSFVASLAWRFGRHLEAQAPASNLWQHGRFELRSWRASWQPLRSHCDHCGQPLRWYELIPLISFALQRGRSRCCHKPLDLSLVIAEATALLLALLPLLWPVQVGLLWWALLCVLAVTASLIDSQVGVLPLSLSLLLLVLALLAQPLAWTQQLLGISLMALLLLAVRWGFYAWRGYHGLGDGDVYLMAAWGAWLPWSALSQALLLGALSALVWALLQRQRGVRFGPFLCGGALCQLLDWSA